MGPNGGKVAVSLNPRLRIWQILASKVSVESVASESCLLWPRDPLLMDVMSFYDVELWRICIKWRTMCIQWRKQKKPWRLEQYEWAGHVID